MALAFSESLSNALLAVAITVSTAVTILLLTAPSQYRPSRSGGRRRDQDTAGDGKAGDGVRTASEPANSAQIVVLGDIGRSPRMQYHAISFAKHGGRVDLIGFRESEVHPDVLSSSLITIIPLVPVPSYLQTSNKVLFLFLAPIKVLWQVWSLYHALGYRTAPSRWMLVQNPPSIPTLAVAIWICFLRNTKLVIDWHNFGYSILALKLGISHPLVRLSKWYEDSLGAHASASFAVTNAMVRVLREGSGIRAKALHDRPASQFQPLSPVQRRQFLERLPETASYAKELVSGRRRLLVSSTSWTPDEDFDVLLGALRAYSARAAKSSFPGIVVIVTGKGPQKKHYLEKIRALKEASLLEHVTVDTAWLSTEDYAGLLASADLGVSLHTSSSGVDLPMKVVDMFGAGLPVVGWSKFEAWPELVKEGVNGMGFESSIELADLLVTLFGGSLERLNALRSGAVEEGRRRWDDEWDEIAANMFEFAS